MREKHQLQDRIILLGAVRHTDVQSVLNQGQIYLNTSLTESFGIGLLEAACAGLYVVSTRVGGVPEVLPKDMISFANPDTDDVLRALKEAISIISAGKHDPQLSHEKIRGMYTWADVAERTENVYQQVLESEPYDTWARLNRNMEIGVFAGQIYNIILLVNCLFFMFLEWWLPREDIDYVKSEWDQDRFVEICHEEQ